MEAFERPHGKTLWARLEEDPRWIVVITGPRQAGKATLVSQSSDGSAAHPATSRWMRPIRRRRCRGSLATALPSVDKRDTRWLVRQWEQARLAARRSERGFILALDEIQKIPDWFETVKGLWDADRLAERGRARVPRANLELQAACRAEGPSPDRRRLSLVHCVSADYLCDVDSRRSSTRQPKGGTPDDGRCPEWEILPREPNPNVPQGRIAAKRDDRFWLH